MNPKLLFASCALFLTSCIAGIERDISISSGEDAEISVEQAREFFEQELLTRNDDTPSPNILSPGDFTPQWDNAQISQNYRIACVDVPIIPTYRYRAIHSEFRRGQAQAYIVNVSQKVVIVKDRESGAMASYIMSLIPDKEFASKHKGDISDLFLNANDRGKYSGAIFYTHHGLPVNYVHYTDGSEDCNISTLGDIDGAAKAENLRNIMKKFVGIKFKKTKNILSRSGEGDPEEPEEEEEEEEDPFEFPGLYPIGSGYYIDNDGNSYFDADKDGIPEREFNLYEDPHEFEETNHENNNTNPDEGDGGGSPQGESDSFYKAMGNNGINKIYADLCNESLRFKRLKVYNGKYILQSYEMNNADLKTIRHRYKLELQDSTYRAKNAYNFGKDVRDFWRDKCNYNPYWIREVITVIVNCDENFSGDFIGTVSAQLDGTTIIVKDAIENTNVAGVGKFTVGLTIK